jgi:hypothetical protein
MIAHRIQIKSSSKDTYWYAGKVDEIFWAIKSLVDESEFGYHIISEGPSVATIKNHTRWVGGEDVLVLGVAEIEIETTVKVKVIKDIELQ